jgi:hypothetical protein
MMFRSIPFALLMLGSMSGVAFAQDAREPIPVRTDALKRLAVSDAAKLLAPYLQSATSGAFESGADSRAITVRGSVRELKTVDSLLAIFDRTTRTVLLRFQIIEVTDDVKKDPRISDVENSLRELFRFPGYRLIGEGITRTEEANGFDLSIGAEGASYNVAGRVSSVDDASGSVRLLVQLEQGVLMPMIGPRKLFGSQLNVPLRQIMVLGSAAPAYFDAKSTDTLTTAVLTRPLRLGRPIILTVRAEIAGKN